jgi:hypothetical protein
VENTKTVGRFRAKFIELYSRIVKLFDDKAQSIYYNGENNLYPNEIELAILNSPTGKSASKIFAKYISGKGVENDYVVNQTKNYNLSNIVKIASTNISRQYGVFFHIGQSLNAGLTLSPVLDILEYTKVRIGKEDDNEYITKYWFKDCEKTKSSSWSKDTDEGVWYYPYNSNPEVILEQIQNDYKLAGGIEPDADIATMLPYYRGQVYYMNLTPEFKYALSPFDAVYNDLDSEYRISMYINRQVRTGFLGKTYVVTAGLDEEAEEQVQKDVALWLGSENVGGTYHLSIGAVDDIDKVFKVGQVKGEIDEKLFTETKVTIKSNIYSAANNVPEQLVKSETSLFGTQSETYIEMKKFYTEQTFEERNELEKTLRYLGFECKIIPIVDITAKELITTGQEIQVDDATKQAQANLRGSVGGVTGVLQVQTSFSQGLTDYQSAITIFTEIYGFSREVADALLGNPEIIDTNEPATNPV